MPLLLLLALFSPLLAGTLLAVTKPIPAPAYSGQCSRCGGWFDNWPGGTCDACKSLSQP